MDELREIIDRAVKALLISLRESGCRTLDEDEIEKVEAIILASLATADDASGQARPESPMESNMTDPKTARDCLAHCRGVLTDEQLRIAVDLIEDYAIWRTADALDQYALDLAKALTKPLTAPKDTAQ